MPATLAPSRARPASLLALVALLAGGCFDPTSSEGTLGASTGDGGSTGDAASTGSMGGTSVSTTGAEGSSGVDPSDSSGSGSDDGDTTGPAPGCCMAGCGGGCESPPCEETVVGTPVMGVEAISVALVGDAVAWSSGGGKSIYLADPIAGTSEPLIYVPENTYVTQIAADDTHVYFLDHDGPTLRRVAAPGGVLDLVTQVPGGLAGYAGLAVGTNHVYFAMGTTGGIYRAAKDLTDVAQAELVANAAAPASLAIDGTHVYWTEWTQTDEKLVRRFPFDAVAVTTEGTTVANGDSYVNALAVDDERVYFSDGPSIKSALKHGTNQGLLVVTNLPETIAGLAVDDSHLYWTLGDGSTGAIQRTPKAGGGAIETLASTDTPWGLALGCNAVYWTSGGRDQSLRTVPK